MTPKRRTVHDASRDDVHRCDENAGLRAQVEMLTRQVAALLQNQPAQRHQDESNTEDGHDNFFACNFGRHVHAMRSRDEALENWHEESAFKVVIPEYDESEYNETEHGEPVYDESEYGETEYDERMYDEAEYGEAVYDESEYGEADYDETVYDEAGYDEVVYDESDYGVVAYDDVMDNELVLDNVVYEEEDEEDLPKALNPEIDHTYEFPKDFVIVCILLHVEFRCHEFTEKIIIHPHHLKMLRIRGRILSKTGRMMQSKYEILIENLNLLFFKYIVIRISFISSS